MKRLILPITLLLSALSISGCVTPVSTIKAIPAEQRASMTFGDTQVKFDEKMPVRKYLDQALLSSSIKEALAAKAAERPSQSNSSPLLAVRSEVEILTYKEPNAALSVLLGDNAELTGYVRLFDVSTNELVGEYLVQVLEGAGGLLGLAAADTNEQELAREFADTFFAQFESEKPIRK